MVRSTPCYTTRYRALPAIPKAFQNRPARYFQLFNNVPCFLQSKGTGWYVTDYARKPESTPKSEAKPEAESKTAAESKTGTESKTGAESSGSSSGSGNGRKSSDAGPKGQKTPSSPNR